MIHLYIILHTFPYDSFYGQCELYSVFKSNNILEERHICTRQYQIKNLNYTLYITLLIKELSIAYEFYIHVETADTPCSQMK